MKFRVFVALSLFLILSTIRAWAWPIAYPTGVTVYNPEKTYDGYTLFLATDALFAFVIDMDGNILQTWQLPPKEETGFAGAAEFLENGNIILGISSVTELDPDGDVVWQLEGIETHHDYCRTVDDTTLVIASENVYDLDISQREIEDNVIHEVNKDNEIIWSWRLRNHYDELSLPEDTKDIVQIIGGDYAHMNSVSTLGKNRFSTDNRFAPNNIIISLRHLNTTAIINKATSEIVWVLGPDYSSYDFEDIVGQHDAYMIPDGLPGAGNIMIFDNGGYVGFPPIHREGSRVIELDPVTMERIWQYPPIGDGTSYQFFSYNVSGSQRLPNANTLICEGMNGRIFEVTKAGEVVWEFINPVGREPCTPGHGSLVYRASRYAYDYAPFSFQTSAVDEEANRYLQDIRSHTQAIIPAMEDIQTLFSDYDASAVLLAEDAEPYSPSGGNSSCFVFELFR